MDAAAPGRDVVDGDLDHLPVGVGGLEDGVRQAVGPAVAELRRDDRSVHGVVVGVAGEELGALAADAFPVGAGEFRDGEAAAAGVRGALQDALGLLVDGDPFAVRARSGPVQDDAPRGGEPGQAVDVAVGDVLARQARHPDHLVDAEGALHRLLDLLPAHARVAVGVDQRADGGQQGSFAVGLQRASLTDESGPDPPHPVLVEEDAGGRRVVGEGLGVGRTGLAPAVEVGVHAGDGSGADDEGGAEVADPQVVVGDLDDVDGVAGAAAAAVPGIGRLAGAGQHHDRLEARYLVRDVGDVAAHRVEPVLPDRREGGPGHVGTEVALALLRHPQGRGAGGGCRVRGGGEGRSEGGERQGGRAPLEQSAAGGAGRVHGSS